MAGEHYVIVDLLNLAPGSSSPANTSEIEMVGRELVISIQPEQPYLAMEDSDPAPQASKKGRRVPERLRVPGARVEDFIPWVSPISSSHPLAKRKKRRIRWLISFITSAHGSVNRVPASSG